jgi:hypothetical protein
MFLGYCITTCTGIEKGCEKAGKRYKVQGIGLKAKSGFI